MLVLFKDGRADLLCTAEYVKISHADMLNGLTIVERYCLGTQDTPDACLVSWSQAPLVECYCLRTVGSGEEYRIHLRLEHSGLRMHADDPVLLGFSLISLRRFIHWPRQHQAVLKFGLLRYGASASASLHTRDDWI